jgi:hypothetical protein
VRFTLTASNTTVDQTRVSFAGSTVLSTTLPNVHVPVYEPRLGSAVPTPLHAYAGEVSLAVSLDGGASFQSQGAQLMLSCASPPPPSPPPPPPSPPNIPKVCWVWGGTRLVIELASVCSLPCSVVLHDRVRSL